MRESELSTAGTLLMNKAFTKEVENHGDHCPACGSIGIEVRQATLAAHLSSGHLNELTRTAFFCPLPTCQVAYFDRFERSVAAAELVHSVYPKDPTAPICPCFGLTCEDIDADIEAGEVTRVKRHLAQTEAEETHCTTKSPTGESCVAAVQRYYMRKRAEATRRQ